jgi:NAD(P)-dependent dehydrogenase (short-subunit alcohol dehydrogenase family)
MAQALHAAGATVVGVARNCDDLAEVHLELGDSFIPIAADAADEAVVDKVMDEYRPQCLVLNAGDSPLPGPLQDHTWETFSRNWEMDVRHAFLWTRRALLTPLAPGSVVISLSSGAAIGGSPLSGGYAGAKATIRFIAAYAGVESQREELGIRFVSVLPQLTAATQLGAAGAAAYATREGIDVAKFLGRFGPALTPERVGEIVVEIASDSGYDSNAYLVTASGASAIP